eukprot:92566-Chlamydomonas_euryale.AAC.1
MVGIGQDRLGFVLRRGGVSRVDVAGRGEALKPCFNCRGLVNLTDGAGNMHWRPKRTYRCVRAAGVGVADFVDRFRRGSFLRLTVK